VKKSLLLFLVLFAVVLCFPLVAGKFALHLMMEILIMAIFVMSLGLIMGYAGMVSLGHAAFFGVGAYFVALLGHHIGNLFLVLALGTAIAGLLAWISGGLFIRSAGGYFLMITLSFGQMLYAVAYKLKNVTGGDEGMPVQAAPDLGWKLATMTELYYVIGIGFLAWFLFLILFSNSPAGKAVKGVMVNESRMRALGYNSIAYKLIAYTLAGGMAGFSGVLYAYFNQYVSPDLLNWLFSGQAMIMVIIGGVGTLIGPAIGAGFFVLLQNYISSYTERWPIIMGLIFIAIVMYGKGGIVHLVLQLTSKLRFKLWDGSAVNRAEQRRTSP